MTSQQKQTTKTTTTTTPTLAELRAQRDALVAQIKAAREAEAAPRRTLEVEIAHQLAHPNKGLVWQLGSLLRRRVAPGQPRTEATEEILVYSRTLLDATTLATANE